MHHAALGVLHAADQVQDLGGGDLFGGDDAVQTAGAGDGGVILPVALGNDLAHALLGGV